MDATDSTRQKLLDACKPFLDDIGELFKWEWDQRYPAILCQYSSDKHDRVMEILTRHLPLSWDAKSIIKAPDAILCSTGEFAKLSKTQKLYAHDETTPTQLIALIWPWSHGATVSIRLLFSNPEYGKAKRSFLEKLTALIT